MKTHADGVFKVSDAFHSAARPLCAGARPGRLGQGVSTSASGAAARGSGNNKPTLAELAEGPYFVLALMFDTNTLCRTDAACRLLRQLNRSSLGPWRALGARLYHGLELEREGTFEQPSPTGFEADENSILGRKLKRIDWKGRYRHFRQDVPTFCPPFGGPEIAAVNHPDEVAYFRCRLCTDVLDEASDHGIYLEVEVMVNPDNLSMAVVDFEAGGCSSVTFSPDTGAVIRERKVREAPRKVEGAYIQPLPTVPPGRRFHGLMGLYLRRGRLAFFRRCMGGPSVAPPSTAAPAGGDAAAPASSSTANPASAEGSSSSSSSSSTSTSSSSTAPATSSTPEAVPSASSSSPHREPTPRALAVDSSASATGASSSSASSSSAVAFSTYAVAGLPLERLPRSPRGSPSSSGTSGRTGDAPLVLPERLTLPPPPLHIPPTEQPGDADDGDGVYFLDASDRPPQGPLELGPWETTGFVSDLGWAEGRRLTPCLAFRDEGAYRVRVVCVGTTPPLMPDERWAPEGPRREIPGGGGDDALSTGGWSGFDWEVGPPALPETLAPGALPGGPGLPAAVVVAEAPAAAAAPA
eukprot:TRINITY_DN4507_c0_g2_i1.p1 TRINITY_DN4507_c0_g2~~TRINITY_DN4507_c0_g2_i1.p1  ORF type:complete len:581 (-),score=85.55 TRINITY_DN4507_c0_g2_i1:125-1867(-)